MTSYFFSFVCVFFLYSKKITSRALQRVLDGVGTLGHLVVGLEAHESTTPGLASILVLVGVVGLDGRDQGGELGLVLGTGLGEGESGGGLLVDDSSETGLALDNGVWDTHLAAKSGQPDDNLDGVNIVSDDDEGSLLGLNQSGDVVKTVLDDERLLGLGLLTLLDLSSGSSGQTLLLLNASLGAVLVGKLEQLGGSVLVQDLGELVQSWGDLETLVQDLALTLEANVFGPLDIAGEILDGLDSLTNTKVLGGLLDQGVDGDLGSALLGGGVRSGSDLGLLNGSL
jgi:hypothetical protein